MFRTDWPIVTETISCVTVSNTCLNFWSMALITLTTGRKRTSVQRTSFLSDLRISLQPLVDQNLKWLINVCFMSSHSSTTILDKNHTQWVTEVFIQCVPEILCPLTPLLDKNHTQWVTEVFIQCVPEILCPLTPLLDKNHTQWVTEVFIQCVPEILCPLTPLLDKNHTQWVTEVFIH